MRWDDLCLIHTNELLKRLRGAFIFFLRVVFVFSFRFIFIVICLCFFLFSSSFYLYLYPRISFRQSPLFFVSLVAVRHRAVYYLFTLYSLFTIYHWLVITSITYNLYHTLLLILLIYRLLRLTTLLLLSDSDYKHLSFINQI